MIVLVTGATGFLGQRICKDLRDKGYEVIASGRNKVIGSKLKEIGCDFKPGDIRDKEYVENICSCAEMIIHSAAFSSPWGKREKFYNINVMGTKILIDCAIENKISKFVFISSTSVYFDFQDRFDIKETDYIASPSPSVYTETKLAAEKYILSKKKDIDTIIIRPRGIFGPYDTTLIPRLLAAHDSGRLSIIGSKETLVDVTYVGNVSHATILSLENKNIESGEIFNITNGEPILLWEMVSHILKSCNRTLKGKIIPFKVVYIYAYILEILHIFILTSKEPILTRYTVGLLAKSQTLNIDKARDVLNYTPIKNMDESLEETITWYLQEGQYYA